MDISNLKVFQFIKHLSDQQLIILVNKSEIVKLKKGESIFSAGETDNFEFFLLAGELEIKDPSKTEANTRLLKAGTKESLDSVARGKPRKVNVKTHTAAALLKVDIETLKALLGDAPLDSYAVKEGLREENSASKQLLLDIYADLRNNKLTLPSLPEVAVRIRQLIDEGSNNAKKIAQAVNSDPAIAAKLIKAANSPLFRGTKEFETSSAAIIRLGMQTTKQLVTSFTMREIFNAKDEGIKQRMDDLWQHCIQIAAICYVLAKHVPGLNPDQGLLAGLLHDIGTVPILIYAEQYPSLLENPEELEQAITDLRGELGGVILKRWGFNDDLIQAAKHAENWHREHEGGPDFCDLVQVAQLHALIGHETADEYPAMESVPAFDKLSGGKLTPEASMKILEEAKQQIEETKALLVA